MTRQHKKLVAESRKLIALFSTSNHSELEKAARRFTNQFPEQGFGWKVLGNALQKQSRFTEAHASYCSARDLHYQDPELHSIMGINLKEMGLLAEAEASVRTALRLQPDYAVAFNNLGNILRAQNKTEEAVAAYNRAISLNPRFSMAYNNLGNAFKEMNRYEEAATLYAKALDCDPDLVEALFNYGSLLLDLGRIDEAIRSLSRAAALDPHNPEARNMLGSAFDGLGLMQNAEQTYREALTINPEHAGLHTNLGNALGQQGRLREAITAYRTALRVTPNMADAMIHLVMATLPAVVATPAESEQVPGDFGRALDELEQYDSAGNRNAIGTAIGARLPFFLSYRPGNHRALLSRYGDIAARARREWAAAQPAKPAPERPGTPSGRLRLAIVSAHVRHHSVWFVLLRGFLSNLDRSRFETILYYTENIRDHETEQALAMVDRFEQGPKDWLNLITKDAPDIIFYPDLSMDPVTYGLALLRLAPLQVTTWGHPITSGLPEIDLFLSGELLEGPNADSHYRERLVLLPGTGACSSLMSPGTSPLEETIAGIPDDRSVTRFLICQRVMKFDPGFDALFADIAVATGRCHFWLVRDLKLPWASAIVEKRLADAFAARGLDAGTYVTWLDWIPKDQFWSFLNEMDVYLDTPAFSGFTTCWQAVHCGLPVVTLEGEFLRQRLAAGLLRKIGVTETIAGNAKEYVAHAVALAGDRNRRLQLRQRLQDAARLADNDVAVVRAIERELYALFTQRREQAA